VSATEPEPAPLGFKVLVAAAALYLVVRLVQGVLWVADRLG
jgi:hypothetical protein